jgi:hypothetical protein
MRWPWSNPYQPEPEPQPQLIVRPGGAMIHPDDLAALEAQGAAQDETSRVRNEAERSEIEHALAAHEASERIRIAADDKAMRRAYGLGD